MSPPRTPVAKGAPGATLDVTILGREFTVACEEAERADLNEAVAYLDRQMRDIRDRGKVTGVDRIAVMAAGLRALGASIEETSDGAIIHGGKLSGGMVDSAGDHRCAMSFAVAGAVASSPVTILDCANVATSFPGFSDLANHAGLRLSA